MHRAAEDLGTFDAVVVGAGFAGLCALHQLRTRGLSVQGLEAGGGVGGTWYWNRYPGARCDVESVDYSYGFDEELQQDWTWTERYATQPEILRYAEHVSKRFDLLPLIRFDTRVAAATYDAAAARWTVTTDDGAVVRARWCVMATGCLSAARVPDIPGIDGFRGEQLHPGQWPQDHEPDLAGKRVGVIGTGSSGIQIVPEIAPVVDRLHVFQRTPNYSIPAHNRPLAEDELTRIKASYRERRWEARRTRRGFPLPSQLTQRSIHEFTPEEQRERLERMWAHGGAIFTSAFGDLGVDRSANDIAAEFVREQIRDAVDDPEIAECLSPRDHALGGKRPCVDTGYYSTFNRDNVELIDIRATPIERFTADGIVVGGREIGLDVVIFATGYDAITGSLNAIDIQGRGGRRLKEHWAEGATAYLGLQCAGFPNLFLITGPGSPSVLCNVIVSIEQHLELLFTLLDHALASGATEIETEADAERAWAEHVVDIASQTVMIEADSWYVGANIPGKARRFMPYAAGMANFIAECAERLERDYEGFRFATTAIPAAR